MLEILSRARNEGQLLLLGGEPGSGKRSFVQDVVSDTDWLLLPVVAVPQRRLLQAAIAQSLLKFAPAEAREVVRRVLLSPGDPDDDLVRLGSVLASLGRPVVLALHRAEKVQLHGPNGVGGVFTFLLGLPLPLLVVFASSQASLWPGVAGGVESGRVHRLDLGPVSVSATMRALRPTSPGLDANALRAHAARLVQQADGLPVHLHAFFDTPHHLTGGRLPLPNASREALLASAAHWTPRTRAVLARLAMIYTGFDAPLARALLGEDVADVLAEGVRLGVLTQAAEGETVWLPSLRFVSSDLETRLGFVSELLRTALAGSLTGQERAQLRGRLVQLLRAAQPGLSAHYAGRGGDVDMVSRAVSEYRAALPPGSPLLVTPEVRAPRAADVQGAAEPPTRPGPRRERQTANGHHVSLACGLLEVRRLGRFAPPPLLRLALPPVPAGHWRLVARVDLFRGADELGPLRAAYPLGLRAGNGARTVFSPSALVPEYDEDGVRHRVLGVPLGRWFEATGVGDAGELEISVRALDVALTVGSLEWNGAAIEF